MENVEKKPKSTKNTNAKDVEKKVSTSKASKANATTQDRAVKSNASKQSASKRGAKTEPKQTDEVVKGQEVAVDTADVERNSSSDDFSIQSQGERIKKNAGKNSKRKKAAIATAVVLLVTASVAIPTAVYLSRRKVSVDISNNIDVIQEYTVNIKRGSTIKDIVPQEITGYTFVGFYKDAELTVPYKDTDKINKNMTIYAKYEANVYKVTFPTSPAFTIEGEDIVNNQVEIEYNTEYRFKLNLATGYNESDITVKVNGETVTPDQDGYYTLTIYGDTLVEVEGVEINTYEVTFYDSLEKNEIYQRLDIDYNELCTYTGVTPTKHSTHTYTYTFIGWVDAEGNEVDLSTTRIVTDLELFANFREEYIEYTISKPEQVNVKFGDLYLSNTATLHYGDIVEITYDTTEGHDVTAFSVSGAEKVEGSENQYKITGNLVVTYSEEIQTFTVQIVSSNSEYGSINQSSITVEYGTTYTVEGNVLRFSDGQTVTATPEANTAQYTYTFLDWTSESGTVTGEATITANFARETNTYTVSIQSNNTEYGTVTESSVTVEYGTEITVSGNTITIGDTTITATPSISTAQYSYSFASWSTGNTTVTGEITITATFTQTVQTYTVTWQNWDGTTLETDTSVPYGTTPEYNGETPTREETASHRYTFTGWDQELNPVTGDITYTAVFDSEIKVSYDFTIEDGIITSYTGSATEVVIPSSYSMLEDGTIIEGTDHTVTGIGTRAFSGETTITSITIPSSVTSIGNQAFSDCSSLTSITIGDGVTSIGSYAFSGCSSLTSITIPDSVTSIGSYAFEGTAISTITIPENVKYLGDSLFLGCTNLEQVIYSATNANGFLSPEYSPEITPFSYINPAVTITITDNVEYIPSGFLVSGEGQTIYAQHTIPIGNLIIGENSQLKEIGDYAFNGCTSLTSITIPSSVTSIGRSTFSGCSSLTSITIPDSVTSIGSYAFDGCSNLEYNIKDGIKYLGNETNQYLWLIDVENTSQSTYTIDENCMQIYHYAFYGCSSLTSITIPSSVTSIGSYAFSGCTRLTSITIPESVTSIGEWAFNNCTSLTSITIPSSVTSIGDFAFSGCSSLTSVTIESNYAYANAGTGYNQCGSLLRYATEVRVLTSCIGDSTNSYLENASKFTKTTSEDGLYYIYTKR